MTKILCVASISIEIQNECCIVYAKEKLNTHLTFQHNISISPNITIIRVKFEVNSIIFVKVKENLQKCGKIRS